MEIQLIKTEAHLQRLVESYEAQHYLVAPKRKDLGSRAREASR